MAREAVELIGALFRVERQGKDFSVEERFALRRAESAPVLAKLREKLLEWKEQLLPKHPMEEAVNYALSQWAELNVFCSDGAVPMATTSALPLAAVETLCRLPDYAALELVLACSRRVSDFRGSVCRHNHRLSRKASRDRAAGSGQVRDRTK